MPDIAVITNSLWSEPPRLRRQVTDLLTADGHEVGFFERPALPWVRIEKPLERVSRSVTVARPRCLIHPQLRLVPALADANARYACSSMRPLMQELGLGRSTTVVNFNHDIYFIRRLFPDNRIITIINDDFESQARFPRFGHVTRALRQTCMSSDEVHAVSTSLVDRLSQWCSPRLFLPWAVRPYRSPNPDMDRRTTLLFWGSIDMAIDPSAVSLLAEELQRRGPQWKLMFVGPTRVARTRQRVASELLRHPNVTLHDPSSLDALPLDDVLAAIIPYGREEWVKAVTLANKTLSLLAAGLPFIITGMPNFIRKPFILRLDECDGAGAALDACQAGFMAWQPGIREFLEEQDAGSRLKQLGIERGST
jgi:hypothetical protein